MESLSLGLIETQGLIAGIEAADAMLKAADVRLAGYEVTIAAFVTIKVVGETAAVRASVDAGRAAAERLGKVVSSHVIPRPDPSIYDLLVFDRENRAGTGRAASGDLEAMTVRELRALARERDDLPLQGREISRATKEELIELLRGS